MKVNDNYLKSSFTAADGLPSKLLLNAGVKSLNPVHIQWLPTNNCNLNCSFCSCGKRDRGIQMPIAEALSIIESFSQHGCRAVTITGGGEPLCHPQINGMIEAFNDNHIKVGLVTNGILLSRLTPKALSCITWCRISNSDEREFTEAYCAMLSRVVKSTSQIDWAFSHVVSPYPDHKGILDIVNFANAHHFTHVRLVADILQAGDVELLDLMQFLEGVDDKVIYQPRSHTVSSDRCVIGYVKPVVAPDFKMYLCCGVQYALDPPSEDLPEELCMGDARNLQDIYGNAAKPPFPVKCVRCYYDNYNRLLLPIAEGVKHRDFL